MFSKFVSSLAIAAVVCSPVFADIIIRDTTDTAVANGAAFVNLTDNFLSSTPSVEIAAASFDRTISSISLYAARGAETDDYSNFEFVFGEVLSTNNYRAQDFGNAIATGQQYSQVGQVAFGLSPTEINPIIVGGFAAEELVFTGLNIDLAAGQTLDLVIGAVPQSLSMDSIAVVYSSGNDFLDRYSRGLDSLVPNLDFPLPESQYAIRIEGVGVPEPTSCVVFGGCMFAMFIRRGHKLQS